MCINYSIRQYRFIKQLHGNPEKRFKFKFEKNIRNFIEIFSG